MSTLGDHLAYYPDRDLDFNEYNQIWNSKKEIKDLGYDKPRKNSQYFNSQRAVQVYMGVTTGNDILFIKADPGTGKTCNTVGISETRHNLIEQYEPREGGNIKAVPKKALILAKNKMSVSIIYKKDIVETCTDFSYMTREEILKKKKKSSKDFETAKTNSTKPAYDFSNHTSFGNELTKGEISPLNFQGRVIVIDEGHELNSVFEFDQQKNLSFSKKQSYAPVYNFMDKALGSIKIIATATPIVNKAEDFVSVINLLLPREERINYGEFDQLLNSNDLNQVRRNLENALVPRLLGRVSTIERSVTDTKTVVRSNENLPNIYPPNFQRTSDKGLWLSFIDEVDSPLNRYKIDFGPISELYYKFYTDFSPIDDVKDAFKSKASQLNTIVWPDNDYGPRKKWRNINNEGTATDFTAEFFEFFNKDLDASREAFAKFYDEINPGIAEVFRGRMGIPVKDINFNVQGSSTELTIDLFCIIRTIRSKYSPLHAEMLEQVLGVEYFNESKNVWEYTISAENLGKKSNQECSFIYHNFYDAGALITGLLLKLFGFKLFNAKTSAISEDGEINITKENRYAIIHSGTKQSSDGEIFEVPESEKTDGDSSNRRILELANHPQNKNGEYLKIIIGTPVSGQGINFENVRQTHMFARHWNEARNKQTEARADRPGNSHKAFNDNDIIQGPLDGSNGYPITYNNLDGSESVKYIQLGVTEVNGKKTRKYVKLFRHALYNKLALNKEMQNPRKADSISIKDFSIGIYMYETAEEKFMKSKIVLDIMERCSFDLKLTNSEQNTNAGKLVPYGWNPEKEFETDYSTYNLFYSDTDIEIIKERIRSHFNVNYRATIWDLVKLNSDFHKSTVVKALNEIVKDQEPLIDRSGNVNFLKEQYDIFFLIRSLAKTLNRSANLINYYSEYVHVKRSDNFDDFVSKMEEDNSIERLRKYMLITNEKSVINHIKLLKFYEKSSLFELVIERFDYLHEKNLLNEFLFRAINVALNNYISYAQKNRQIFHILDNYAKFEISGRTHSNRQISHKDYREIRIFDLDERKWRNIVKIEAAYFGPMIKDRISVQNSMQINKNFSFNGSVGTATRKGENYKKYSIQSTEFYETSNSRTVANSKKLNEKSAKSSGTEINSWSVSEMILILLSVEIDMYCQLIVYNDNPTGYVFDQNSKKAFILYRLKEIEDDSTPLIHALDDGRKLGRVNFPIGEGRFGEQCIHYSPNRQFKATSDNIIATRIVHFNRIHPAIMGWVFSEELEGLHENIEKIEPDSMHDSEYLKFYFQYKNGSNLIRAHLPDYPNPNFDYYTSLLHVLYGSIKSKMLGSEYIDENNPINNYNLTQFNNAEYFAYLQLNATEVYRLGIDSKIITSVSSLPEYVNPAAPVFREEAIGNFGIGKDNYFPIEIKFNPIYKEEWDSTKASMGKAGFAFLIYLIFHLTGRNNTNN